MASRITDAELVDFITESNYIESILRPPTAIEIMAHLDFLKTPPTVASLQRFVLVVANAELRTTRGMDVRVGNHLPPPGGPAIVEELETIVEADFYGPWYRHIAYEALHPFMDGNGRSGRALWLSEMLDEGLYVPEYRFLRHFYYQSLQGIRDD